MLSIFSVTAQVCALLFFGGRLFAWMLPTDYSRWVRGRLLPIMVGFYAIGILFPYKWPIYALIVATIPLLSRNRSEIAPVYLVTILALPQLFYGIGVGGIYILVIDKVLCATIGALIAFYVRPSVGPALRTGSFDIPILLYVLLESTMVRGFNMTGIMRGETDLLLTIVVPYFILSRSMTRPVDVTRLMVAFAFGGFVLSIIGVFEMNKSFPVYEVITQRMGLLHISSFTHQRAGALRGLGPFSDATSFGIFLSTTFIVIMALKDLFKTRERWRIALVVVLAGLYAANTRSALLGLGVGLLALDFYRRRYGSLLGKVALIGGAIAVALAIARVSVRFAERIGVAGDAVGTVDYRRLLITRGLEEMNKHPWFGVTGQQAFAAMSDLRQGEGIVDFVNAYIWYGLTTGYPGMIVFLLSFLLPTLRALMLRRRLRHLPRGIANGSAIFAVCLFTTITAFTAGFNGRNVIIYAMMLMALSRLGGMRRERAADAAAPTPRPAARDRVDLPGPLAPALS